MQCQLGLVRSDRRVPWQCRPCRALLLLLVPGPLGPCLTAGLPRRRQLGGRDVDHHMSRDAPVEIELSGQQPAGGEGAEGR